MGSVRWGGCRRERQLDLLRVIVATRRLLARAREDRFFSSDVGLDDFRVVEGERESVEHLRRAELRITLEDAIDAHPVPIERVQAPHRHAGADDVRAPGEDVNVDADVRMRHQNDGESQGEFL